MELLSLGICSTARKENENRVPLHPGHFDRIPAPIRKRIYLERGFGIPFGISDEELEERFGGVAGRREILSDCDIVVLPKPMPEDLREVRERGIVWGWPHCVQQREITQAAIDRRLTLIAWEEMYTWKRGERDLHL
ncbi:MAG: alanine dehydrogenase, partial [bacterium]|nr:alanine dehydrogenase [bacterium]